MLNKIRDFIGTISTHTAFLLVFIFLCAPFSDVYIHASEIEEETVEESTEAAPEAKVVKKVRLGYMEKENFQEGEGEDSVKYGYAYDYLQAIAGYAGWEYEYVYGEYEDLYDMVVSGEIDIMADVSYTDERASLVNYSEQPLMNKTYSIYVHEKDKEKFMDEGSFEGMTVSVGKRSQAAEYLKAWEKEHNYGIEIVEYDYSSERYKDFESYNVDATVDVEEQVDSESGLVPVARLGSADSYLIVAKDRTDLMEDLVKAQNLIDISNPFFKADLSKKYFSETSVRDNLTPDETMWIREHSNITVGYIDNYAPYSDQHEGTARGLFMDVLDAAFDIPGVESVTYVPYPTYNGMLEDLLKGRIDMIGPVYDGYWYSEQSGILQSSPLASVKMDLVTRRGGKINDNSIFAVSDRSPIQPLYIYTYFDENPKELFADGRACIRAVSKGKVDATVINAYESNIYDKDFFNIEFNELDESVGLSIATTRENAIAVAIVNRAITEYGSNRILDSLLMHTEEVYTVSFSRFIKEHLIPILIVTGSVLVIIGLLVILYMWRNRQRKILDDMAYRDSMTGLYNRRSYDEDYERLLKESLDEDIILISFDMDGLKTLNEKKGHAAGDEAIKGVGRCLDRVFGKYGDIYRIAGDEFVAIIKASKEQFDNLENAIELAFDNWRGTYSEKLTVSWGSAARRDFPGQTLVDLAKVADERMYRDKFSDRDTYRVRTKTGSIKNIDAYSPIFQNEEDRELLKTLVSAYEAQYDTFTGLPSMSYFLELLNTKDNPIFRGEGDPSIIAFNLNGLKIFNSRYGLQEGDNMIKSFGAIIESIFGKDNCSRFGEDRFYAVSKTDGLEDKLANVFGEVEKVGNGRNISVRAGIYKYISGKPINHSQACDNARIACDYDKKRIGSRYTYFKEEMIDEIDMRDFLIENLDKAINSGHIKAYYQPKVSTEDGSLRGFEVLARWIDPEVGFISPSVFIPVLEDYSLTYKVDKFIVEQAVKDIMRVQEEGLKPYSISFNVSRTDFLATEPSKELVNIVEKHGVSRSLLRVEVTESSVMFDPDHVKAEIAKFRQEGFEVLMDDFGSGYSSLSTLRDFEFDEIKIDMGFMKNFSDRSRAIVRLMVDMAKELGIHAICEGVETEEQVEFLRKIKCEQIQGFYFGKPEPIDVIIERWLRRQ